MKLDKQTTNNEKLRKTQTNEKQKKGMKNIEQL